MTTAIVRVSGNTIISEPTNYQGYTYDADTGICTPTNNRCIPKWNAVKGVFQDLVHDRTFMDIGASFGFFCLKALELGATASIGLEKHPPYYRALADALSEVSVPGLEWVNSPWPNTDHRADVVMILAVIHHAFPRTPLEKILDDLWESSNRWVIAEWIARDDKQVRKKGYAPQHPEYNKERFLALAGERFGSVSFLGNSHHKTRFVYLLEK